MIENISPVLSSQEYTISHKKYSKMKKELNLILKNPFGIWLLEECIFSEDLKLRNILYSLVSRLESNCIISLYNKYGHNGNYEDHCESIKKNLINTVTLRDFAFYNYLKNLGEDSDFYKEFGKRN